MTDAPKHQSIGGRGKKRGLVRTVVSLEPEQVEALRKEAMERMVERKVGRMDTGEVIREHLDQRAQVVALGHRVAETALKALPGTIEAEDFEAAAIMLDTLKKVVAALDDLLRDGPSREGERFTAAIAKTEEALRAKSAAGGKGKKGGRK